MNDYHKRQAEVVLGQIQSAFGELNLPAATFGAGNCKGRTTKWKILGKLQNLLLAISRLMFVGADPKVALQYMMKAFTGWSKKNPACLNFLPSC